MKFDSINRWRSETRWSTNAIELRDMVQQPIHKKEVHLTSRDDVVKLKTDVSGTLPDLSLT